MGDDGEGAIFFPMSQFFFSHEAKITLFLFWTSTLSEYHNVHLSNNLIFFRWVTEFFSEENISP